MEMNKAYVFITAYLFFFSAQAVHPPRLHRHLRIVHPQAVNPPSHPIKFNHPPGMHSPLAELPRPGEVANVPQKEVIPDLTAPAKGTFSPIVKQLCGKTDYPDICLNSLSPYLKLGKVTLDPLSILKAQTTATLDRTKQAITYATKISKNPKSDPFTARVLSGCKDSYKDVIENIEEAMKLVGSGGPSMDYDTINTHLSAAITNSGTCSDGFSELPGDSPTADYDTLISHQISIAIDMVNFVKGLSGVHPH